MLGAILGAGGGKELDSAVALQAAQKRYGRKRGTKVWKDFRRSEDPEAPVTVLKKHFPYQKPPRKVAKGSLAMPDRGSVRPIPPARGSTQPTSQPPRSLQSLLPKLDFGRGLSNALLVSARESRTGRPLAVFGPQTGYFSQQPLFEEDIHGPGMDARGMAVIGTPYVAIGRGRDYAWSATSAGQDYTDTFALPLCEPNGRRPTINSMYYRYRGVCRQIEVIEKPLRWQSNLVDPTPSGSETLHAERTLLGLGTARATIKGKPVIYVKLRATYGHEIDRAALAVESWNDPNKIRGAARLPAPRRPDDLHVQLVLRRSQAHRLRARRRQPDPGQGGRQQPADVGQAEVRVAQLRPHRPQVQGDAPSGSGPR